MKPDEGDLLIHRHLEGALSEEEAAALGARVKSDPAFRRRMAEMAFDRAQMKDVLSAGGTGAVPVVATPRIPRRALLPMAAAAIILASVGIAVAMWSFRQTPAVTPSVPAAIPPQSGYAGFAGRVTGKVVSRADTALTLRVLFVPGQGPDHPLVGAVIHVGGGITKTPEGQIVDHTAFIRRLERNQEETLDVRHSKDDVFVIGELTPAQLEWTRGRDDGRRKPAEGREDPARRTPERPPKKEAGKEAPRDGQDREGPPKERPKEE